MIMYYYLFNFKKLFKKNQKPFYQKFFIKIFENRNQINEIKDVEIKLRLN